MASRSVYVSFPHITAPISSKGDQTLRVNEEERWKWGSSARARVFKSCCMLFSRPNCSLSTYPLSDCTSSFVCVCLKRGWDVCVRVYACLCERGGGESRMIFIRSCPLQRVRQESSAHCWSIKIRITTASVRITCAVVCLFLSVHLCMCVCVWV